MHASGLLAALLGRHLLPAAFSSLLVLMVLALLFQAGRLRRPAYRVLFLYAALLKALIAVWIGEGISCLQARPPLVGYVAIRLPTVMAPDGLQVEPKPLFAAVATSDLSLRVLFTLIVLLLCFFCYRWFRLAPLFRGMRDAHAADPGQFPGLYQTFDSLVERAWGDRPWPPRPRLLVVRAGSCFAFTMGVRPPVVVVSAELVEQLAEPELQGILAHELAHVRRLDYVGRWIAAILRDLMVWNPAAHVWYRQLTMEQEKASDEQAAALLGDPMAVASGLVELAAYAGKVPLTSVGPLSAWGAGTKARLLEARLVHLERVSHQKRTDGARHALVVLLLVGFLMAQPHVVVPLNRIANRVQAWLLQEKGGGRGAENRPAGAGPGTLQPGQRRT